MFLTDAEIDSICEGVRTNAARCRRLRGMGLIVNQKPNGRPLVLRSHAEAVLNPRPAAPSVAPAPISALVPRQPIPWEETPLGRMQVEERRNRAEAAAALEARMAALPVPTRAELRAAAREQERRRKEARAAIVRFHAARRRVAKLRRTPPWADQGKILAIYERARALSIETGVPHHVDHEIPLQGALVSGLHVHENLQILTGVENSRKRNQFEIAP